MTRVRLRVAACGAVALILLVVLVGVVGAVGGHHRRTAGSPAHPATSRPGVVPSVFGYRTDQARARLEAAGYSVVVHVRDGCAEAPDRVTGTTPHAGRRLMTGSTVTFTVDEPTRVTCHAYPAQRELAWELLDLARGTGPGPRFAPTVRLWVDNALVHTLTASQAAESDAWAPHSALRRMSSIADMVGAGTYASPGLVTSRDNGESTTCGDHYFPPPLRGRTALLVQLFLPMPPDDYGRSGCTFVNVFTDARGRVDAVLLRTQGTGPGDHDVTIPDVRGLSVREARRRLLRAHLDPVVEAPRRHGHPCRPTGPVTSQSDYGGGRTVVNEVVVISRACRR